MGGNRSGWRYWFGAVAVVLLLLGIGNALAYVADGTPLSRRDNELIIGLLAWPSLVVYHVLWTRRKRRDDRSQ